MSPHRRVVKVHTHAPNKVLERITETINLLVETYVFLITSSPPSAHFGYQRVPVVRARMQMVGRARIHVSHCPVLVQLCYMSETLAEDLVIRHLPLVLMSDVLGYGLGRRLSTTFPRCHVRADRVDFHHRGRSPVRFRPLELQITGVNSE